MTTTQQKYLAFAKEIALEAGKIMEKYFYSNNGASYKGDRTIVTLADKEINSYLIQRVKEEFPEHSVDGEEEKFGDSEYVWVCDPVDGTAMYARHIPVAVFSLALVVDGVPEIGVIYDVYTNSMFSAVKGEGAYRNGEKICVNDFALDDVRSFANYDMMNNLGYNVYDVVKELGNKINFVCIGSAIRAFSCVASGDFNFSIFPATKNCDVAAAKVIVEEAGGKVTDLWGKEQRYDKDIDGAVVSNGVVHEEVLEAIRNFIIKVGEQE